MLQLRCFRVQTLRGHSYLVALVRAQARHWHTLAMGAYVKASSHVAYLFSMASVFLSVPLNGTGNFLTSVRAQVRIEPLAIKIQPSIRLDSATEAPLTIGITPETSIPKQAMLLIRGLPSSVTLAGGRLFDSGVWGVRIADLPRLRIAAGATQTAKAQLAVSLVTFDGTVLAEASTGLSIEPRNGLGQSVAASVSYGPGQAAPPIRVEPKVASLTEKASTGSTNNARAVAKPTLTPQEIQQMEVFMRKGVEHMRTGNIPIARQFFERAANTGWGPAAIAMGATFDARELAKMHVVGGIRPEPETARKWYQKAAELGVADARERLEGLNRR
jgi:hypothetical protein